MVIWYFIDRTQIVKHENAHNFKKLSTLQTSYLDFLSDPIVRKGATKIRKSVEKEPFETWCDALLRVVFRREGKHVQYTEHIVSEGREAGLKYPSQAKHCHITNT